VMASLRDYGIYLGSIGGAVSLRLDNKLTTDRGGEREENTLTSSTAINTKGFIWDPRFMTVDLGLKFSTSKTEADTYESDEDAIGFRFKSVLFPRWRYPYLPIRLSASKITRSADGGEGVASETDYTRMLVNWGLFQKHLGRVRTRYAFTMAESTGRGNDKDTIDNNLSIDASRSFLKGKRGETDSDYGYSFDSLIDRAKSRSDMQHDLFINNRTKFGKKIDLSSNALFYQRYYDGTDAPEDEYFFSSNAVLRVQSTKRFRHNYTVGVRSTDEDSNYYGGADASYTYAHDFNKYLMGTASTRAAARYMAGTGQAALMQVITSAAGDLAYRRMYDVHQLEARYNVSVMPARWESGNRMQDSRSDEAQVNQSALLRLSRPKNPIYSDAATLRAQYQMGEEESHLYAADYSVTSKYQYANGIASWLTGNANVTEGSQDSSLGFGSSAALRYRFGRRASTSLNAHQRWRRSEDDEYSLLGVRGVLSGQLYRRFNVRFSSELGWTRRFDDVTEDETEGSLEVSASMGKLVTSLKYTYIEEKIGSDVSSDQTIMLQIMRYFGWRL